MDMAADRAELEIARAALLYRPAPKENPGRRHEHAVFGKKSRNRSRVPPVDRLVELLAQGMEFVERSGIAGEIA